MKKLIVIWTTLSLLLASVGCTSMQEVRPAERPLGEILRTGDHVIVYEDTGRVVDMRYVRTDGTVLRGSLFEDGLTPVSVDLERIERVEVERVAVGRTSLAVVGGIIVVPIAALGLGMSLAEQ